MTGGVSRIAATLVSLEVRWKTDGKGLGRVLKRIRIAHRKNTSLKKQEMHLSLSAHRRTGIEPSV